jgi:hypothetical protein
MVSCVKVIIDNQKLIKAFIYGRIDIKENFMENLSIESLLKCWRYSEVNIS